MGKVCVYPGRLLSGLSVTKLEIETRFLCEVSSIKYIANIRWFVQKRGRINERGDDKEKQRKQVGSSVYLGKVTDQNSFLEYQPEGFSNE